MAKIDITKCDSCGALMEPEQVTTRTHTFRGLQNGSYIEDLCHNCIGIPEGVELKPLRTRGKGELVTNASDDAVQDEPAAE